MLNARRGLLSGVLIGWWLALLSSPVTAQHPVENIELMVRNLREFGQPVIPLFEGWFPGRDGGHDLCFGYYNMNLEEVKTVPVGPDNRVEPARYDGPQPTHFDPVPPSPLRHRRTFCAFTVHVDNPSERVTWTLRFDGRDYAVPSNDFAVYQINEPNQDSRGSIAPIVRFEPSGIEDSGRHGDLWGPPLTGTVGRPVELTVSARRPMGARAGDVIVEEVRDGSDLSWFARWALHSGPGSVTFSSRRDQPGGWVTIPEGGQGADAASFSAPGQYVLRLQVIDEPGEGGSFQFQCCWTNAYVEVDVSAP